MIRLISVGIILLLISWSNNLYAQQSEQIAITESDTLVTEEASTKNGFFSMFKGKPGRAALYSLIIPGAGQLYNRKYWKAPIVWGIEGYFIYDIISNAIYYYGFKQAYIEFQSGHRIEYRGIKSIESIKSYRDSYLIRKEKAWVYFALSHLLNVIDAFVDRHLMEYDISEDLSIDVMREKIIIGNEHIDLVGLQFAYRF